MEKEEHICICEVGEGDDAVFHVVVKITSRDIRGSRVKREELGRGVGFGVNGVAIKRFIGLGAVDVVMRTFSGRGREGDRRVGVDELVHKFEGREFQDWRR